MASSQSTDSVGEKLKTVRTGYKIAMAYTRNKNITHKTSVVRPTISPRP